MSDQDRGGDGILPRWSFPEEARSFSVEHFPTYRHFNGADTDGEKAVEQKRAGKTDVGL